MLNLADLKLVRRFPALNETFPPLADVPPPPDSSLNKRRGRAGIHVGVPQSGGASLHTAICPHISGVFVHVSHKHAPASKTNADCRVELPTFSVRMSEYYVLSMFDCFRASRVRANECSHASHPRGCRALYKLWHRWKFGEITYFFPARVSKNTHKFSLCK